MDNLSLFNNPERSRGAAPLAERMRPRGLDEFLGQGHLIGEGKVLRQAIENDALDSLILWGPPGTGKTTLARIIAGQTGARFETISAVTSGIKEVKALIEEAKDSLALHNRKTILFVDEIHRFNKSQQDAFLPWVEDGTIVLIGATTENPSFEINAALLSRSAVQRLHALSDVDLKLLLQRAVADETRGLGKLNIKASDEALDFLASMAGGDARRALTSLEQLAKALPEGSRELGLDKAKEFLQKRALLYDKNGEEHYNLISALHKSVRSSDPHAAAYWCTRMLESGEDPLYVCRRLVRMASEDIGNADPAALQICMNATQAYQFLGSPEGEVPIIQAALYLACSPKSNSAETAYFAARDLVQQKGPLAVPLHLRNAPTKLMKQEGYGEGYQYAHHDPDAVVTHANLPEGLEREIIYRPVPRGKERDFIRVMEWFENKRAEKRRQSEGGENR
jgi:putative ATPase